MSLRHCSRDEPTELHFDHVLWKSLLRATQLRGQPKTRHNTPGLCTSKCKGKSKNRSDSYYVRKKERIGKEQSRHIRLRVTLVAQYIKESLSILDNTRPWSSVTKMARNGLCKTMYAFRVFLNAQASMTSTTCGSYFSVRMLDRMKVEPVRHGHRLRGRDCEEVSVVQ